MIDSIETSESEALPWVKPPQPAPGDEDAPALTKEEKALGAFLSAMHDCNLDGSRMREAMMNVLGIAASKPEPRGKLVGADFEQIIDNYLDGYELRGDEGDHTPTEFESLLIKDAIMGLLVDEAWDNAWGGHIRNQAALLAADKSGGEVVAWRDYVEQRLLNWRQRIMNRSGDHLALDDFMDKESLDDLIDYVCSEYEGPATTRPQPQAEARPAVRLPLTPDQLAACASNIADSILFDLQGRKKILDGVDEQVLQEIIAEHTRIIAEGLRNHGIGKDLAS